MRVSFFILSLLLTLVSCSQGKHTTAKFSLEIGNLALSSAGGLVIFGKENAGAKFTLIANGTSVTLDVPKGTWTFNAMAWDGANGPMTGVIICAQQTGIAVSGDSLAVNLKLDNATCFSSSFTTESGMPDGGGNLKAFPLDPYFCETDVSGLTNTACQYDPSMPSLTPRRGFVGSYKFSIPAGASFGSVSAGETLESDCYVAGTNNSVTGNNIGYVNIPSLASSLGLPLHLDAYLGAACEPAKGKFHLSFDNQSLAKFGPGPSMKKVYGRTPLTGICAISDLQGTTDLASGTGTTVYPFVICNPNQLYYLQRNASLSAYNTAVFILGRDINLISGIGGGSTPMDPCLDAGDTFVPIGQTYDGSCNLASNTPAFAGSFDGNNFTIYNLRMKNSLATKLGFISETTGYIANVTFSKASVEGSDYTGVAVGYMSGATSSVLKVKVIDSDVRGDNYTGGIAGYINSSYNLTDLFVDKVEIEGRSQTGGIIGDVYSGISRASFNGTIRTNSTSDQNIGGIAGRSANSFNQVASSGTIRGSQHVGGIVGTSGAIIEARSDMLIKDTNPDTSGSPTYNVRYIGGIAGDANSVTAGLFTGTIQSPCNSAACKIGGIIGNGSSSSTDSYSVQYPFTLGGVDGIDTSFSSVYGDATLSIGLCTTVGGGCHWLYNNGDMPRIAAVDDSHFCVNPNENNSFANQKLADPTKGTTS
ncbi:MAG: hypothetical protein ACJ76H_05615, partial [Bacteriovoracaceae bacterium]